MQEGLAAVFGNGLSTACVVNIGAQVTSVICIEVCYSLQQCRSDLAVEDVDFHINNTRVHNWDVFLTLSCHLILAFISSAVSMIILFSELLPLPPKRNCSSLPFPRALASLLG